MFGCSRKALRQRRTCPVEMRKTRVETCIGKAARPLPPVYLGSGERIAVFGGVPVMELVDGQGLPRAEQHTVGAGGQAGVAEPHKPPDLEALPGQHARHRVGRAVGVL